MKNVIKIKNSILHQIYAGHGKNIKKQNVFFKKIYKFAILIIFP